MDLLQHSARITGVMNDAETLCVVHGLIRHGNRRLRIGHLDELHPLKAHSVKSQPPARQGQSSFGHVDADKPSRAGVDGQSGEVVSGSTAVIENDLAVVLTPEPGELAEQRILGEAPLEVAAGPAATEEGGSADRVPSPVGVHRRGLDSSRSLYRRRVVAHAGAAWKGPCDHPGHTDGVGTTAGGDTRHAGSFCGAVPTLVVSRTGLQFDDGRTKPRTTLQG